MSFTSDAADGVILMTIKNYFNDRRLLWTLKDRVCVADLIAVSKMTGEPFIM